MGRIIGIDYGRKRLGLAITDPMQIIASPLTTMNPAEFETFMADYIKKEAVESFVIGFPMQLDNTPSESMKDLVPFVKRLKKLFPQIPVYSVDERFTSVMAQRAIIDGGVKKQDRREKALVDKISATLILRSFLENRAFYMKNTNMG